MIKNKPNNILNQLYELKQKSIIFVSLLRKDARVVEWAALEMR